MAVFMGNKFRGTRALCSVFMFTFGAPAQPPPASQTSLQQIEDLVSPVALYPDSLLSQILVASTYPLEIVEAQQWLSQHPNGMDPSCSRRRSAKIGIRACKRWWLFPTCSAV